ncbi:MAG: hypothetical protein EBR82_65790 [Caulobacteraceae bacterium]|nr:hypothetical protein [Caulobacteraceae bacterium]
MPAGRPSKPTEIKRKLGNPGQRKLPDQNQMQLFDPIVSIPEPARPLLKYGREFWDKVWLNGLQWISPNTDAELLLMTCELIDERWNLRVRVMQSNDWRERRGLRDLDARIISNLSLLGFTPADRSKLGVAEVKAISKMEALKRRQEARANESK